MGVKVRSMVSIVPKETVGADDVVRKFGEETANKIIQITGVKTRHIAKNRSTLELAYEAGIYAIKKAEILPENINGLLLVTQTPEYRLPPTACILQNKLGLKENAFALDIGLGCSGFPYGFLMANSLINSKIVNCVLLIVGDVTSMNAAPEDQSTYPLFADGFGAVILEEDSSNRNDLLGYSFGTDGEGWKNLVIHTGLSRHKTRESFYQSGEYKLYSQVKYPDYVYMDGSQIFIFCLKRVPEMMKNALDYAGLTEKDIDSFCFHQANGFLIQHLRKKINLPEEKVPICLDRYGNTSSSSTVLAACDAYGARTDSSHCKIAFITFGVGYSWSTVILELSPEIIGEIKEV